MFILPILSPFGTDSILCQERKTVRHLPVIPHEPSGKRDARLVERRGCRWVVWSDPLLSSLVMKGDGRR